MGVLDLGKGVKILNADEVRDQLQAYFERRYGAAITRVEETGTGWRFIGQRRNGQGEGEAEGATVVAIPQGVYKYIAVAAGSAEHFERIKTYRAVTAKDRKQAIDDLKAIIAREYARLTAISCGVATGDNPNPEEGGAMAHPELATKLGELFEFASGIQPMEVISGFRPLGMTAGDMGYTDSYGANDASDDFGHWCGKAADLRTKDWRREGCENRVWNIDDKGFRTYDEKTKINELDYFGDLIGVFRPWKIGDPTHWSLTEGHPYYKAPEVEWYDPGWNNSTTDSLSIHSGG